MDVRITLTNREMADALLRNGAISADVRDSIGVIDGHLSVTVECRVDKSKFDDALVAAVTRRMREVLKAAR